MKINKKYGNLEQVTIQLSQTEIKRACRDYVKKHRPNVRDFSLVYAPVKEVLYRPNMEDYVYEATWEDFTEERAEETESEDGNTRTVVELEG